MNGNGDPNKMSSLPIYGTSNGGVHQMNGVVGMNGGHLPHNYYLTGDMNDPSPSCSNDTAQSDMWMLKSDALQESGGSVGMNEAGMGYSGHHHQLQQHFDQSSGQLDPSVYSYSYYPQDEYPQQPADVETSLNLKNSMCKLPSQSPFRINLLIINLIAIPLQIIHTLMRDTLFMARRQ